MAVFDEEEVFEQRIATALEGESGGECRQLLEELFGRYRGQRRLLDRLVRISDGFQSAERQRSQNSLTRYEQQIRQLEKIVRISDHYQKMLFDLNRNLEQASNSDPLTGLPNRRYMTGRLKEAVAEAERHPERGFALMLADIDRFKAINDTFGHAVGDEVLKGVAGAMTTVLREYDVCARWGGEEFLLLFPGCSPAAMHLVAERLLHTVRQTPRPRDLADGLTISIGHTMFRPGESIDDTLQRADAAMYRAKGLGRDRAVGL
jgi:diguanylate cyclase (GGDEF)-like protein